jgi:hypothetical protein
LGFPTFYLQEHMPRQILETQPALTFKAKVLREGGRSSRVCRQTCEAMCGIGVPDDLAGEVAKI